MEDSSEQDTQTITKRERRGGGGGRSLSSFVQLIFSHICDVDDDKNRFQFLRVLRKAFS